MDVPNSPRELVARQIDHVLNEIDDRLITTAQRAALVFLKGSSTVPDYVELSKLLIFGAKQIYTETLSANEHGLNDDDTASMARRSKEIVEQIEELVSELAFLNGIGH